MIVRSKKTLELCGVTTFVEGKEYDANVDEYGDIIAIDEESDMHRIAEGSLGDVKDEWFVEHFDIVSDI